MDSFKTPLYARSYTDRDTPRTQLVPKFLNQKTNEGFTPLHFACFKGNLQLVKILIEKGCRTDLVNEQGLGIMHVAAQADQVTVMTYLKEVGIPIMQIDKNGSTPLH